MTDTGPALGRRPGETAPLVGLSGGPGLLSLPASVWVLAVGQFVNAFGNFLPVFLVLYLTSRGVNPARAALALSCYGAARVVAPLMAGPLVDRVARRVVIACGMTLSATAVAAIPSVGSLHIVMVLTAAAGAGAALTSPAAAALLADLVPAANRVQGFAVQRLAVNVGYATGPATAGLLVTHGYWWLFVIQPTTCAIFAALSLAALPSSRRRHDVTKRQPSRLATATWRSLLEPRPARLFLALTVVHAVYYQTLVTLPLVVAAAGRGPGTYGFLASLNGLLVILLELPIATRTRRKPRPQTVAAGFLLIGFGISGLGLAPHAPVGVAVLVVCVLLYTLGEIVFDPVAQTYITELAPPDMRARYQVAFATSVNCGYLLAPLLGGFMYVHARHAFWPVCLLLTAAAAVLVAANRDNHEGVDYMSDERVSASTIIDASADVIFEVLADPTRHAAIDGTGRVGEPLDIRPLTAAGQVFRMAMYHPNQPGSGYQMANRIQVFEPPTAISWEPGEDPGNGRPRFGGWTWRYDLAPAGPSKTEVTLTYDWSAVPAFVREHIQLPPFRPDHLGNSLAHLAELVDPSA